MPTMTTALQVLSLLLISLIVGSMFGIWRGYNPATFSPATFVEVHQGAVRGLNILLPAMALVCILAVVALAWLARGMPQSLWLYIAAAVAMVAGGLITRFGNQPINAVIMAWGGGPARRVANDPGHLVELAPGSFGRGHRRGTAAHHRDIRSPGLV